MNFEITRKNIINFLEVSNNQCKAIISLTVCDNNKDDIGRIKNYWQQSGINIFFQFDLISRGGALNVHFCFLNNDIYLKEAEDLLIRNKINPICEAPFLFNFIGWDGLYYMCCHDYSKKHPLGSIFDYNIDEIFKIKKSVFFEGLDICEKCIIKPVNSLRETLFRIERNIALPSELDNKIKALKNRKILKYI